MPDGDAHDVDLPEAADGDDLEDAGPDEAGDDTRAWDEREPGDAREPALADGTAASGESPFAALVAAAGPHAGNETPATWADESAWAEVVADGDPIPDAIVAPGAAGDAGWGGEGGWESLDGSGAGSLDAGTAAAFEALVAGADDAAIEAAYAGQAGEVRDAIEDLLDGASPTEPAGPGQDGGGSLPFAVAFGAIGGAWAAAPPTGGVGYGTAPVRSTGTATEQPAPAGVSPLVAVTPLAADGFAAGCNADHGGSAWWGPRRDRSEDAEEDARAHAISWPGHGR